MRLQMVSLPDIVDGGLAHPLRLGEQPTTPLAHASRLGAQRRRHDRRDLAPPVAWLAAPARGHFPQTVQALLRKALAPQRDRLAIDLTSSGNGIVGLPFSRRKHNPTPQGNLLWGTEGRHPLPQLLFICLFELQRWRRSWHPFIIVRPCVMSSYLLDTSLAPRMTESGRFETFGIDSSRRLRLITRLQSRFRFISRNFPLPTLLLRQHLILPTMLLHPTFGGTSWLRPARKALPSTPTVISPSTKNIAACGFFFDSGRSAKRMPSTASMLK